MDMVTKKDETGLAAATVFCMPISAMRWSTVAWLLWEYNVTPGRAIVV